MFFALQEVLYHSETYGRVLPAVAWTLFCFLLDFIIVYYTRLCALYLPSYYILKYTCSF